MNNSEWRLVRIKRSWVPEWLFAFACCDLWILPTTIGCYWPFRQILTKKIDDEDA